MPRSKRIEYEGAFHHVMNRGRSHGDIFHGRVYYESFLNLLKDSSERFDAVVHAYCLMTNHYHLLIETPKANLSRIMRHINGVYTQKYNWLTKKDGTLFKGRYKSVLINENEYLLQLTRYIHRNPIETKKPMVKELSDYKWSSYLAYINQTIAPGWLYRNLTYEMLGHKQRYKGYQKYVDQGIDEELRSYYDKHNILSILGDQTFKREVLKKTSKTNLDELRLALSNRPMTEEVIKLLCKLFKVKQAAITENPRGKRQPNSQRAFAMYACQYYGSNSLKAIGEAFHLSNPGSASYSISRIKKEVARGKWKKERAAIEQYIVKRT